MAISIVALLIIGLVITVTLVGILGAVVASLMGASRKAIFGLSVLGLCGLSVLTLGGLALFVASTTAAKQYSERQDLNQSQISITVAAKSDSPEATLVSNETENTESLIPLDDEEAEEEASSAEKQETSKPEAPAPDDPASDDIEVPIPPAAPQPDWVDAGHPVGQENCFVLDEREGTELMMAVFTTDVETTARSAKRAGDRLLIEATAKYLAAPLEADEQALAERLTPHLDEIANRLVTDEHLEERETSVGKVYLHHRKAMIDDESKAWLNKRFGDELLASVQRGRAIRVALAGGGILALVGLAHGVLRRGQQASV